MRFTLTRAHEFCCAGECGRGFLCPLNALDGSCSSLLIAFRGIHILRSFSLNIPVSPSVLERGALRKRGLEEGGEGFVVPALLLEATFSRGNFFVEREKTDGQTYRQTDQQMGRQTSR